MSDGYGRSKPGRPVSVKRPDGPTCETCRNLDTESKPVCGLGHSLDPSRCGAFKSAAIERIHHGGTSGRKYER